MPRPEVNLQTLDLGSPGLSYSSSVDSELRYRKTARAMTRPGSITPPEEHDENTYPNVSSEDRSTSSAYPPARVTADYGHKHSSSVGSISDGSKGVPKVFGFPLKYVSYVVLIQPDYEGAHFKFRLPSLVTLALQNASLVIIMHYSRVTVPPNKVYSASAAVLMNEILKGVISFTIAFFRTRSPNTANQAYEPLPATPIHNLSFPQESGFTGPPTFLPRLRTLLGQIASKDSWKLSIPALLYVLQNNLQYVAVTNLDVPTFQVTNQMKILTTAACSVVLLRKRLTGWKWASLALLTAGVAIVQIQASMTANEKVSQAIELPPDDLSGGSSDILDPIPGPHALHPLTGFLAVISSCFTSGLAGVYFEMVLKGSKADLWVRNVQLSLWSLIPALLAVLIPLFRDGMGIDQMFANFSGWAWCTVFTQVLGGLLTALVIKYADNILKGFATSLSIILSFLLSVIIFDQRLTTSFAVGATIVLGATWMYNSPDTKEAVQKDVRIADHNGEPFTLFDEQDIRKSMEGNQKEDDSPLTSPLESDEPLLGHTNGASASRGSL
ncbi:hypothetical protein FRC17_005950 [Serendipita sp. 399]|nr:hypothetical protein FRC17_005950 [Serendipita sp. 399]